MAKTFGQENFAELAWNIAQDSRSLALLRGAMSEIQQRKQRGARLRRLRKERSWSTWLLAQRAGLGVQAQRSVENWESGHSTPQKGEETWKALAKALKVSFHYLYYGEKAGPRLPAKDIVARLDAQDEEISELDRRLELLEAGAAAQAAADAARQSSADDPQSDPKPVSNVTRRKAGKRRVARR